MSSLIFYTSETEELIATDTLVVSLDTKEPIYHCSKALYLPHVNTIIASTGLAGFADQWCLFINNGRNARCVDDLTAIAQPFLWEAFNGYKQHPFFNKKTFSVTVYHFGFSKKEQKIKAFAHRSVDDFEPKLLSYGLGVKPDCELPPGGHSPESIILPLMKKQIAEQEQLPETQRLFIGGEVHAFHLTSKNCISYKVGDL